MTEINDYQPFSDEHLFLLVQQDDKKAFEVLYNRYWAFLLNAAYKPLQARDKAEDLVQDIFISLYQRRKSITLVVSLRAYLCKALKFKLLNELRSQMVRDAYSAFTITRTVERTDFDIAAESKELEQVLHQSVEQLPEKCKTAFLLSRQGDFNYNAISEKMDISVSTVEKHISKALSTIRLNLNLYQ